MKAKRPPVYVTQPHLPPLEEFLPYLEEIWQTKRLTNSGPFHERFERSLESYLSVPHVSLFTNGTLALMVALQALRITGEVVTTPYSFVATTHALAWNGIQPVFSDIDPDSFNLDPAKIERAITPRTSAILPVHVYGNPCNVEALQRVADLHGLRVIYDAAHAFGVRVNNTSILNFGDLAILSFHATKVFNTFEGGAIVCHDAKLKERIDFLKNCGYSDEVTVVGPGINAKMSEFNAALGLLQLKYMESITARRRAIFEYYQIGLTDVRGIRRMTIPPTVSYNYAYFPTIVESDYPLTRDELYLLLRGKDVYARRYFYPLISEFPTYRGLPSARPENLEAATSMAKRVLCLPVHPGLGTDSQDMIIDTIRKAA